MTEHYPNFPGFKGPDKTGQESAEAIAPCVSHLRQLALRTLAQIGPATVLEAVVAAGVTRESLQPRYSELRRMGLVEPSGERKRNPSGKSASVLRLTERGQEALASG